MSVNIINSDGSLKRIAGGTLYADAPIGTILSFGGSTIPSGYLLCNGQAVSRTNYAELFTVIGTAFGSGDGSTTFNVPDLRESVPKGAGLTGKTVNAHLDADGLAVGEFLDDRIKAHEHNVYVRDTGHAHTLPQAYGAFPAGGAFNVPYIVSPSNVGTETGYANIQVSSTSNFSSIDNATTTNGSNTNEVKAVGVNYIIKAKQVAVPFDVAEYIRNQNVLSEYESITLTQNVEYIASYDGVLVMATPVESELTVNDIRIGYIANGWGGGNFTAVVKKGDKIKYTGVSYTFARIAYYKFRDYTGR